MLGKQEPWRVGGFFTVFHVLPSSELSTLAADYHNNDNNYSFMCCLNPGMGRPRAFLRHSAGNVNSTEV